MKEVLRANSFMPVHHRRLLTYFDTPFSKPRKHMRLVKRIKHEGERDCIVLYLYLSRGSDNTVYVSWWDVGGCNNEWHGIGASRCLPPTLARR